MKKYIFFAAWALIWGFIIKTLVDDYAESQRIAELKYGLKIFQGENDSNHRLYQDIFNR